MEIVFTGRFEQAYEKLSGAEKESIQKALSLLEDDLKYHSLHVKKL